MHIIKSEFLLYLPSLYQDLNNQGDSAFVFYLMLSLLQKQLLSMEVKVVMQGEYPLT